ncbi:MAG: hypothetical protein PHT12_05095 [Patescibacteria group bacterium]|nr:hypothetical protein [Patescibacteria group bacterium]
MENPEIVVPTCLTPRQAALFRLFVATFPFQWEPAEGGGNRLVFTRPEAVQAWVDAMVTREEDEEYYQGMARVIRVAYQMNGHMAQYDGFAGMVSHDVFFSHLLTALLRVRLPERASELGFEIEALVSHVAQLVNELLSDEVQAMSHLLVEWMNYVNVGDPARGFEILPTAWLRGVVFSAYVEPDRWLAFWRLADKKGKAFDRLFVEPWPCPSGNAIWPGVAVRLGRMFNAMPILPAMHFAGQLGSGWRHVLSRESPNKRWQIAFIDPATRGEVLSTIVDYAENSQRKTALCRLFRTDGR